MPGAQRRPVSGRGSQAPSAMQTGALLAAARQRPRHQAAQKQQINQVVKLGIGLVLGVMLVLGIIFGIKAMQGPARPVLGNDAEVLKEMQRVNYEEVRSWRSQGHDRMLMGHNEGQTTSLVDEIYKLNPKQVLAGGSRMSMRLIIELPEDKEARTLLFAWHNEWTRRFGHVAPPERDVGQRDLMVLMPGNR